MYREYKQKLDEIGKKDTPPSRMSKHQGSLPVFGKQTSYKNGRPGEVRRAITAEGRVAIRGDRGLARVRHPWGIGKCANRRARADTHVHFSM